MASDRSIATSAAAASPPDDGQLRMLVEPSAAEARAAVHAVAPETGLTSQQVEGLVLAVSEVVANAHRHGAPPVRVSIAPRSDGIEVRVHDAGPGPDHLDVAAARRDTPPVPADATEGRGLWLAQHSSAEVEVIRDEAGCTIHLRARRASR